MIVGIDFGNTILINISFFIRLNSLGYVERDFSVPDSSAFLMMTHSGLSPKHYILLALGSTAAVGNRVRVRSHESGYRRVSVATIEN